MVLEICIKEEKTNLECTNYYYFYMWRKGTVKINFKFAYIDTYNV